MTDRWRLVNGEELYDIQKDPGQKNDVAAEHADVVNRLRGEYERWWADIGETRDVSADHPDLFQVMKEDYHNWMDDRLGSRPDPLRLVCASGKGAWTGVKARYERHLAEKPEVPTPMTPRDRARIDDEPERKTR